MERDQAIDSFSKRFFGTTSESFRVLLESISRVQKRRKKEVLFLEGEEGHSLHFLLSGRVKLYRANEEGKEAVIRFVQPGEYFAEILLELGNRYPVNAIALEDCVLLLMDVRQLFDKLQSTPGLSMALIGTLARRITYLLNRVEQLTVSDVRKRFIRYLQLLDQTHGTGVVFLPAPKREVALLLGTTPETFSRLLKKLSEEQRITVQGKTIQLLAGFRQEMQELSAES